jgi:D-alanine-D-alanine ligase
MEINTIPGLSEASIFPQQLNHYGFSLEQAFAIILETCLSDKF